MNAKILASSLIIAATAVAAPAIAATDTSNATVTITNQSITLTNDQGLNFGTILPYGRAGNVTVNTLGQHSVYMAFVADASAITASAWSVTGVPGAPFSIILPPNNTATVSNGTETMTVTGFARSGGTGQMYLDAAGNAGFNVGATLNVGANQPPGVYSGTFDVTVAYN